MSVCVVCGSDAEKSASNLVCDECYELNGEPKLCVCCGRYTYDGRHSGQYRVSEQGREVLNAGKLHLSDDISFHELSELEADGMLEVKVSDDDFMCEECIEYNRACR